MKINRLYTPPLTLKVITLSGEAFNAGTTIEVAESGYLKLAGSFELNSLLTIDS